MPHDKEKDTLPEQEQPVTETADTQADATPNAAGSEEKHPDTEQQAAELNDRYMRLMAEYDNYRKRTTREREALYKDVQARTLEAFLTVADNFDRAMQAPTSDPDFKKGMALIHTGFTETLERFGVEKFGEAGDAFDPTLHEAVAHVEDEEYEAGIITQVYNPGYKMEDRVLRHATVVVAN